MHFGLDGSGVVEFADRVEVEPGGTLAVALDRGAIRVESHEEDSVVIEAQATGPGSATMRFELLPDEDGVHFEGRDEGWLLRLFGLGRVLVRARVPTRYSVALGTRGGPVEVDGITGSVDVRTSGGRIEMRQVEGPARLRTSGGRIEVEELCGDLSARTSGGRIELADVDGDVEARTSGGHIHLDGVVGHVDAHTSGGHIHAWLDGDPAGTLRTSGGHIEVSIARDAELDLEARTSGGRVELDASIPIDGRLGRRHVEGAINGGGERLRLRTSGGHIRVLEG